MHIMKKLSIALAAAGLVAPGLAVATNGDNLIGLGAQARALGGTGTAAFYGAENTLSNPAMIAKMQGTEFSIAGTAFMPDVRATWGTTSAKSDAELFAIPEVALASRINEHWTWGLGMYGTSGMGVDYRGVPGLMEAYSNLQIMKFVPSVAYNNGRFGLGAALAIQYGALDFNYRMGTTTVGNGTSSDFGTGVNLGAYFDVMPQFTVGLSWQSEIDMKYKDQLSTATAPFGLTIADKLTQPSEMKVGVAYTTGPWLVTADYKRVNWGDADGYKTFNWDDQNVFGIGVKYAGSGWWVGAGYNRGDDPIKVGVDPRINMFNNLFFPAIVENHYTLGGGLALGKNTSLDVAYVHAKEVTKTVTAPGPSTQTTKHSQDAITVSVRMNF